MHYIKFLKLPSYDAGSLTIKTKIAVTTDLGDDYFPNELPIQFDVLQSDVNEGRDATGAIALSQTRQWSAGMRVLTVELKLTKSKVKSSSTFRLRVSPGLSEFSSQFDIVDGVLVTPAVMPIVSERFHGGMDPAGDKPYVERSIPLREHAELSMWEETGDSIARHIWDGSVALSGLIDLASIGKSGISYLDHVVPLTGVKDKIQVIELGAGVGLAGLILAKVISRAHVLLTDVPEVEILVRKNAAANKLKNVDFKVNDWSKPTPDSIVATKWDLILISECTYNEDSIPDLVSNIVKLMTRSPDATIIVATKQRHENERLFSNLMAEKHFEIKEHIHALCPRNYVPGDLEDADKVDIYTFTYIGDR